MIINEEVPILKKVRFKEDHKRSELLMNRINHMLIAINSSYMTYIGFHNGLSGSTLHGMLCTLGYQLLMGEAILSMFHANSWSIRFSREKRKRTHWILMIFAEILIISGVSIQFRTNGFKIGSIHSIFGLLSLIAMTSSNLNGTATLWIKTLIAKFNAPDELRIKTVHTIAGSLCFFFGSLAFYFGLSQAVMRPNLTGTTLQLMKVSVFLTTCLTLFGPAKTLGKFYQAYKKSEQSRIRRELKKKDKIEIENISGF